MLPMVMMGVTPAPLTVDVTSTVSAVIALGAHDIRICILIIVLFGGFLTVGHLTSHIRFSVRLREAHDRRSRMGVATGCA